MIPIKEYISFFYGNNLNSFSKDFKLDIMLAYKLIKLEATVKLKNKKIVIPKEHAEKCKASSFSFCYKKDVKKNGKKLNHENENLNKFEYKIKICICSFFVSVFIKEYLNEAFKKPHCSILFFDLPREELYEEVYDFYAQMTTKFNGKIVVVADESSSSEILPGLYVLGINQNIQSVRDDLNKILFFSDEINKKISQTEIQVLFYSYLKFTFPQISVNLGRNIKTINNVPSAIKRRIGIRRNITLQMIEMCTHAYISSFTAGKTLG